MSYNQYNTHQFRRHNPYDWPGEFMSGGEVHRDGRDGRGNRNMSPRDSQMHHARTGYWNRPNNHHGSRTNRRHQQRHQHRQQQKQKPNSSIQQQPNQQSPDMEMLEDDETSIELGTGGDAEGGTTRKLTEAQRIALSKVTRRRHQNEHLGRLLGPKSPSMVLDEMLHYKELSAEFEDADNDVSEENPDLPRFRVDLTVDGVVYKGVGKNKGDARDAASEQALRDLIIKRMRIVAATNVDAPVSETEGDPVPMDMLLSLALHKLFEDWRQQGHDVPHLRRLHVLPKLSERISGPKKTKRKKKPQSELPVGAAQMHPGTLLSRMRPQLHFRDHNVTDGDDGAPAVHTITVDIDDKAYTGKGSTLKEARKVAAAAACLDLFDVHFEDSTPANMQ